MSKMKYDRSRVEFERNPKEEFTDIVRDILFYGAGSKRGGHAIYTDFMTAHDYKCDRCGRQFVYKDDLRKHYLNILCAHVCELCGAQMMKWYRDKIAICTLCGKQYDIASINRLTVCHYLSPCVNVR
jgi:hypothetical protein